MGGGGTGGGPKGGLGIGCATIPGGTGRVGRPGPANDGLMSGGGGGGKREMPGGNTSGCNAGIKGGLGTGSGCLGGGGGSILLPSFTPVILFASESEEAPSDC